MTWKFWEKEKGAKSEKPKYKPVVLLILDGFGVNISLADSTWKHARMSTFRELEKFYPFTTLQASGIAVGLPWGEEGNSEVGHMTIGAGKVLHHHFPRIIMSIYDKSFFKNPAFLKAADFIKKSNGRLHLMGLLSSGSVHAYIDHLYALLDFASAEGVRDVNLHLFTDGRDSPTNEGALLLRQLEERMAQKYPFAKIASVCGRFYAMDRDENFDRIKQVYECVSAGDAVCNSFSSASQYVDLQYKKGLTDEFIEPGRQEVMHPISSGDSVIFYNFREDSVRELTSAFLSESFNGFKREKIPNLFFVTMTEYSQNFKAEIAFPPLEISTPLSKIISERGLQQLHIAETEKYAHVTYFFNGGREEPYPKEDRMLIRSERVQYFDQKPEMSAEKVTETILENLDKYDFILANYANGDMVGHTGNFAATVKALEVLDVEVGRVANAIGERGGSLMITGDHGNAEEKIYSVTGEKRTKHTANSVPIYIYAKDLKKSYPREEAEIYGIYDETKGVLTDVAPTVLGLMGFPRNPEMTGVNLMDKVLR
ncbi:2,3-bisphosphoglycerate-independent phosphoglycerate mutase [Candidatus Giovannonibacteria bacterium]|nr:2,3-bisphosphoglycerate-independent phosphoglycerate mutase [Candidatus Giovannonibacteria bacterium]